MPASLLNSIRCCLIRPPRSRFRLTRRAGFWILALAAMGLQAAQPSPITARPAAELVFHPELSAPAEVTPLNDAQLSAELSARILDIPVRVGDQVAPGDLLARLDCRDYQARLEAQQATSRAQEARLRLARIQLQRARSLEKARNISSDELDRQLAEAQALEAELAAQGKAQAQARLNVERCEIRAPFRAAVTARLASVGALAAPGTPLLRLVQLDGAEVSAQVRPEQARAGREAASLTLRWRERTYPLRLLRELPVLDPRTRTLELRLGFTGEAAPPGASGRLVWRDALPHVPADLLVRRGERLGVFLNQGGQAHFHPLPEALEGQPAPAGDLPADARVILEGRQALEDGAAVTETPAVASAKAD